MQTRFDIRFRNGVYHVFDTHLWKVTEAYGLLKAARASQFFRSNPVAGRSPARNRKG